MIQKYKIIIIIWSKNVFLNFNEKQIKTHSQTSRKSLPIHTNTSDSSIWKVCIALPPAITPRKLENA
jgi:hypothetical protein